MDTMSVQKYTTKFIQLMRYVPGYTEAEEQRKHYHMMDPPQALQGILVAHNFLTLKKLVNTTALVEMDHK